MPSAFVCGEEDAKGRAVCLCGGAGRRGHRLSLSGRFRDGGVPPCGHAQVVRHLAFGAIRWFGAENAGRGSAGLFGAEITGAKNTGRGSADAKNTGAAFCLNVKCPPDLIPLLTGQERGVYPAYHMNRTHWVTVRPCECADDTVRRLVQLSYTLTQGKAKARARKK